MMAPEASESGAENILRNFLMLRGHPGNPADRTGVSRGKMAASREPVRDHGEH
jgi:hypothetical protein